MANPLPPPIWRRLMACLAEMADGRTWNRGGTIVLHVNVEGVVTGLTACPRYTLTTAELDAELAIALDSAPTEFRYPGDPA